MQLHGTMYHGMNVNGKKKQITQINGNFNHGTSSGINIGGNQIKY